MVPSQIAKCMQGASDHGFCGCGMAGTLVHVLWNCPRIKQFWTRVYQLTYTVSGDSIPENP